MKIALINPPDENRIFSEVPRKVNVEAGLLPPMGLLYLEAALSSSGWQQVEIIDCSAVRMSYPALKTRLQALAPDLLGVTGHTHNLIDMVKVSRLYKSICPKGTVVWGGAHATAFPLKCLGFEDVDFAISGEGEQSLPALLKAIQGGGGQKLENIGGLAHRNPDGAAVLNPPPGSLPGLDSLPHPRRERLDPGRYSYTLGGGGISSGFVSSRGCPYHCKFCSTPGSLFRWRSARDVVDEMEECRAKNIDDLYFVDDTFNVQPDRVEAISREIEKRGLEISWNYRGRVDLITPGQLKAARRAGCNRIQLGVETATDEGMMRLGKDLTVEGVRQAFSWVKKSGITSVAYFMIGCPHETTREEVLRTVDFAVRLAADYALFGILTPYPGTRIFDEAVEKKLIDPADWQGFVENPSPGFVPPPWTEFFTPGELQELLDVSYRRFYGRPGYLLKRLLEVRSPGELWRKLRAGLSLLGRPGESGIAAPI